MLPSSSEHDSTMEAVLDEKDVKVEVMRSGGAGGQVSAPRHSQSCLSSLLMTFCSARQSY